MDGAAWRRGVLEHGTGCPARTAGPCWGPIEIHHIVYKSRGGGNQIANGIPLCKRHHMQIHARTLLIRRSWLRADQLRFLAHREYVDWDDDGEPFGTGWKGFAPSASRRVTIMVQATKEQDMGDRRKLITEVDEKLYEDAKEQAKREDRSLAALVRHSMRVYLESQKAKTG